MAPFPAGNVPLIQRLWRWLRPAPATIDDVLWRDMQLSCPWSRNLDPDRAQRLRVLATRFLHEKQITPLAGLELDERQRLQLALLCCLPLIEFGAEGLYGWTQMLVYPDAFRVRRSQLDDAGVLHEWDDELIGEAWGSGPLILSWADVQADIANPHAGFCVAVHEMAHKIDALDGALDGTPPLPREWQRQWAHDFQHRYDAFRAEVEAGRHGGVDAYAAEAPEEFFAVVSECHFCAPQILERDMPEVAAHLRRFYGPSPFAAAPAALP